MKRWRRLGVAAAVSIWLVDGAPWWILLWWNDGNGVTYFGAWLLGEAAEAGLTGLAIAWCLSALASRRIDKGMSAGFLRLALLGTVITATLVIVVDYAVLDSIGPRFGP